MSNEMQALADALFANVQGYVERSVAPLLTRIKELEAKAAVPSLPDYDAISAEVLKRLPAPEKGEDGKSVTLDDVAPMIREAIAEAVAQIPAPKDGEPGKDADPAEVRAMVDAAVEKAVSEIPTPKDGEPGKDGIGAAGAIIDRDGNLIMTMTDGRTCNLGRVIGKDAEPGKPGEPGKDGLGFDDMTVEHDGERSITLRFSRGDLVKTFSFDLPVMIYRQVFSEGKTYQRGDTVTWGGSLWHCNAETAEMPGDGSKSWTLAAKRGRDGKGEKGDPGKPGKDGRPGKNLTWLGQEGLS